MLIINDEQRLQAGISGLSGTMPVLRQSLSYLSTHSHAIPCPR